MCSGCHSSCWTARLHPASSKSSPFAVITPHMTLQSSGQLLKLDTANWYTRMGGVADFVIDDVACMPHCQYPALACMTSSSLCAPRQTIALDYPVAKQTSSSSDCNTHISLLARPYRQLSHDNSPYLTVAYWALFAAMGERAESLISDHHCTCVHRLRFAH